MPFVTEYFFGVRSWPGELCLWGLFLFGLGCLFYWLKLKQNRYLDGLTLLLILIGTLFVQSSYIYLLINNLKTIAVIMFLIIIAAAIYPIAVEKRHRFFW